MYDAIDGRDLESRDGFDLRLDILPDSDAKPSDTGTVAEGGCYSDADIEAWKADHWTYVVQRVTASRAGVELGTAYLGAVEHGDLAEVTADALNDPDPGYLDGMIDEAIAEARNTITAITE